MSQDRLKDRAGDINSAFDYELGEDGLRVRLGSLLLRAIPYDDIERVEKGWAPGWQVGGHGMPSAATRCGSACAPTSASRG